MHILDGIVDKIVRQIFNRVRGIPRKELIGEKFRKVQEERRIHLTEVTAKLQKAELNLDLLKTEVLNSLKGESAFPKEMLAEMIADTEKECAALEKSRQAAQDAVENGQELIISISSQYEKLVSWAELYDTASMEAKKMIVNQLIKRVDVGRNYQVNITFNFSYEQFIHGLDLEIPA